ncbi:kappa-type opioid receptor-like [Liolophura sinensis]|uniref:kappa-type opioid receptor-like n=1 Tax=Liolophura sinensis TaxID=3198878 RepID=UPI003158581C
MGSFENLDYHYDGDMAENPNDTYYNNRYCDVHQEYDGCVSSGLPDVRIATTMQRYVPPILTLIGTLGNIFLLVVMRHKDFGTLSVFVYLRALAVSNTVVLYVSTLVPWACFMASQPHIADWTDWGCRLWTFVVNVLGHSPVWFAVGMVIDRYIVVWHPNKALEICSVFISKIVIITILTGLTTISVHAMWTYELDNFICVIPQYPDDIHSMAWPWIWDTFYYFLPLLSILMFSVLTLMGFCLKKIPQGHRSPNRPDEKEATITTLILCMTFFLLAAPATTVKIMESQIPDSWLYDIVILRQVQITRSLVQMLSAVNNAITFFVVVIVSSSFRLNIKRLCLDNCYLRNLLRLPEDSKLRQEMATTHVSIEDSCTETTPL